MFVSLGQLTIYPFCVVGRVDDHYRHDGHAHKKVRERQAQYEVIAVRGQESSLIFDCD